MESLSPPPSPRQFHCLRRHTLPQHLERGFLASSSMEAPQQHPLQLVRISAGVGGSSRALYLSPGEVAAPHIFIRSVCFLLACPPLRQSPAVVNNSLYKLSLFKLLISLLTGPDRYPRSLSNHEQNRPPTKLRPSANSTLASTPVALVLQVPHWGIERQTAATKCVRNQDLCQVLPPPGAAWGALTGGIFTWGPWLHLADGCGHSAPAGRCRPLCVPSHAACLSAHTGARGRREGPGRPCLRWRGSEGGATGCVITIWCHKAQLCSTTPAPRKSQGPTWPTLQLGPLL